MRFSSSRPVRRKLHPSWWLQFSDRRAAAEWCGGSRLPDTVRMDDVDEDIRDSHIVREKTCDISWKYDRTRWPENVNYLCLIKSLYEVSLFLQQRSTNRQYLDIGSMETKLQYQPNSPFIGASHSEQNKPSQSRILNHEPWVLLNNQTDATHSWVNSLNWIRFRVWNVTLTQQLHHSTPSPTPLHSLKRQGYVIMPRFCQKRPSSLEIRIKSNYQAVPYSTRGWGILHSLLSILGSRSPSLRKQRWSQIKLFKIMRLTFIAPWLKVR